MYKVSLIPCNSFNDKPIFKYIYLTKRVSTEQFWRTIRTNTLLISYKKTDIQYHEYYKWADEWEDEYYGWTDRCYKWTEEYCEQTGEWTDVYYELTDEYHEWINEYYRWINEYQKCKNDDYEWEKSITRNQTSNNITQGILT